MMKGLGGPLPSYSIKDKVRRDAEEGAADTSWIRMIVPDASTPQIVAGSVVIWSHDEDEESISEIGWMVLPEFQGRGLGKLAARTLLERAREENRWGDIHAHPATSNAPSNGVCRSLGFQLLGEVELPWADRVLRTNHWVIDPRSDLRTT
jgi:RimJ/RimL family protein N-acetyltransferase